MCYASSSWLSSAFSTIIASMETRVLKEMIEVVKAEQQRREAQLQTIDSDYQYDRWLFTDLPFVSEMYLMILVALHHQIERGLVKIAARLGSGEISSAV